MSGCKKCGFSITQSNGLCNMCQPLSTGAKVGAAVGVLWFILCAVISLAVVAVLIWLGIEGAQWLSRQS